MRTSSCLVLGATLALILALFLYVDQTEASPGRRGGGGGGRRGGIGGGGWFSGGSRKTSSSSGSSWYGGGSKKTSYGSGGYPAKKKGGIGKTLKKAAVIGAVAYGSYQLGKLAGGYSSWGWGRSHGYGFNDWNRWREVDGFLCRETSDCSWIDPRLYCQDYELDFQPSALWFGGDAARIVGECACPYEMFFDDRELQCRVRPSSYGFSGTNLILVILIPLLIMGCCCIGGIFLVRKMCF